MSLIYFQTKQADESNLDYVTCKCYHLLMSHNPYLPDNMQETEESASQQNSLTGLLCGMLIAMVVQAILAIFLFMRFIDPDPDAKALLLIVLASWLISYLIGWSLNGKLFSERELDPSQYRNRYYRNRFDQAESSIFVAILQFFCGALYTGVQALLGRKL